VGGRVRAERWPRSTGFGAFPLVRPRHPTEQHKFVNAGELTTGTTVTGPHGEHQTLTATRREMYLNGVPVYNFRVAEYHTYFVGERPDDTPGAGAGATVTESATWPCGWTRDVIVS